MGVIMREEIELFLRRAEIFRRDAEFDFRNGNYDICMFHLEQAFQLLIKAKLLEVKGSYSRTHLLRRLLLELAENWNRDDVLRFIEEYKTVLRDLERAYISSRYTYEEFFEEEVKRAFHAYEELRKLLWRS